MARPKATPEQRAEDRRRLRRAAMEIHREDGLAGISVRSVTRRAGVSPAALYTTFSSLHELVRSLWAQPVAAVGETMRRIATEHDDPVERIRALLDEFADFVSANSELHRHVLLFVRAEPLPSDETRLPDELPFFELLVDAVREGQANGSIQSGDPRLIAQLLWSAVHGALALPVNADLYELAPGAEAVPHMIDLAMASLAPDRSGASAGG